MRSAMIALFKQMKIAFLLVMLFSFLTGFLYPMLVTGFAQWVFPWQANGSIIMQDGKAIGSHLIGQYFDAPHYFWGRPSATTPFPYNAASSAGSNLSPTNQEYLKSVKARAVLLQSFNPNPAGLIPVDLVTASGSGLDPEISPEAAYFQISRIAKARHVPENIIRSLAHMLIQARTGGILGKKRVNVLDLNIALDKLRSADGTKTAKP